MNKRIMKEREMGRDETKDINKRKNLGGGGVDERFPSVSTDRCQVIPQARLQVIQSNSQN
jgi:hypothetical protein